MSGAVHRLLDLTKPQAVALTLAVVLAPLRFWSGLHGPSGALYAHLGPGVQILTGLALLVMGVVAYRCDARYLRYPLAASVIMSAVTAGLLARGQWESGAWLLWTAATVVLLWTFYVVEFHRASGHDE